MGLGYVLLPLAARYEYVGIDTSPAMLERAMSMYVGGEFGIGSMTNMVYNDEEFDNVMCVFGLPYSPRPEIAALEMMRVLKPGGKFVITGFSRYSLWRLRARQTSANASYASHHCAADGVPTRFYSPRYFKGMFTRVPGVTVNLTGVSALQNLWENPALRPLDNLICKLVPMLGHHLILQGEKHG